MAAVPHLARNMVDALPCDQLGSIRISASTVSYRAESASCLVLLGDWGPRACGCWTVGSGKASRYSNQARKVIPTQLTRVARHACGLQVSCCVVAAAFSICQAAAIGSPWLLCHRASPIHLLRLATWGVTPSQQTHTCTHTRARTHCKVPWCAIPCTHRVC